MDKKPIKQETTAATEDEPRPYFCPVCHQEIFRYQGDVLIFGTLRVVGVVRIKHSTDCIGVVRWKPSGEKQ